MQLIFYLFITTLLYYCLLLLLFKRGFSAQPPSQQAASDLSVSVLVPAHNEERCLPDLLKALEGQTYPKKRTEIILINDRSTDATGALMDDFAEKHNHVHVIHIEQAIPGIGPKKNALSQGIEKASGEIILTTDADSQPGGRWIESMVSSYDNETGMVLGYAPYRTDAPYHSLFHKLLALDYFAMGAVAAASAGLGKPSTCNGANFSYRKDVFKQVGGFGSDIRHLSGDDDLLMQRVHKRGLGKIRFNMEKGGAVFNNPPENLKHFIRQRIRFASKHLAYPPAMVAVLGGVYLFHLMMVLTLLLSVISFQYLQLFAIGLIFKGAADFIFLKAAAQKLENRNLLKYYPVAAIPYLIYVVIFPLLGQIMPRRW